MQKSLASLLLGAALTALPPATRAGTVTFAEFNGLGDNSAIPSPPSGLPEGIAATWTGFLLHTVAGDTPMSVFPVDNDPGGTIAFSGPVMVSSINAYDTGWGGPVTIIAKLQGVEIWRHISPGDSGWTKLTLGAGKLIDSIQFLGQWNHYDDIVVEPVPMDDTDQDGLPDFWEYKYFPGDLTKLADVEDFDGDGLSDLGEYTRGTDPTKTDTDGDGLNDAAETGTGVYNDPTDTGTSATKADTDGDGRKDGDEINGTPTSNPFVADTDGDTFRDGDEVATGHDPNDANNNPLNSAIANSFTQFSGTQGQSDWYYGYRNYTKDGGGDNYNPDTGFIQFTPAQWTGSQWDLDPVAENPWTELAAGDTHPNSSTDPSPGGYDTGVHWTIRRWVANPAVFTQVTPLAFRWHVHKGNVDCGNGVTGGLYVNGQRNDAAVIVGGDGVGVTHTYYVNVAPGDRIDVILSPRGTDGVDADGCDGSYTSLLVDPTIPTVARQPDGSLFIPVGAGDTDADGLPDAWEYSYFPDDLTQLSDTGDFDQDGLSDTGEYIRGGNPTKTDTDGDGLSDLVETDTGIYVDPTDTGSDPAKADTDGDGLSDSAEVTRTPPTNPNKSDTDGDGYSDPEELNWRSDPTDPDDKPTTFVIGDSQAEFSGTQGQNGWYNGYRIFNPLVGVVNYDPAQDFVPYPGGVDAGAWNGVDQTWTGGAWDLNTAAAAPWTYQDALGIHPNGTNSPATIGGPADPTNEQWAIRRWVADEIADVAPVTVIWKVRKTSLNNDGVTGLLFINGGLIDAKALAGNDGVGEVRQVRVMLRFGDIVDLALTPVGKNGDAFDYSDGSESWFRVDTRAWATDVDLKNSGIQATADQCTFKFASQPGARYVVFGSSNLKDWVSLQTVVGTGTETTFTDTLGTPRPPMRFYRVTPQ